MSDTELEIRNPLREKMASGKLAVGMISRLVRGVEIVAIAKTAGFDCLFIDLEHNGFSHETVSQLCIACNLGGITPLVRVGMPDAFSIAQAMDCGAQGVIVPEIETAEDARLAVAAAKYPPVGRRSIMPCLPQLMFRPAPTVEAMQAVNAATMVISMIEGPKALDAVEEIASVEGLDMLLVGANDLSNTLGLPGQLDHPEVKAGFQRVADACRANGIYFGVGGMGQHPELAKEMIAMGARYATAGADITFMSKAAIANARKFDQAPSMPRSSTSTVAAPFRQIGTHRLRRVLESIWRIDVGFFFADATRESWEPHLDWMAEGIDRDAWMLQMPIQAYLIETPDRIILVDACVGAHKDLPQRPEWNDQAHEGFAESLGRHGLGFDDIDMVLCTHMHLDHTGWNTRLENGHWVPSFRNATYVFAERELAYWQAHPTPVFRQNILPVLDAGQALVVADTHRLGPDVRLVPSPGHSPGHVCVEIDSDGQRAVLGGDVMHSPIQCRHPEWHSGPDMDKAAAARTRTAFLERYCDAGTLVCMTHFPLPSAGYIRRDGAAFTFEFDTVDW